jgi:hypothetical protein
VNICGAVGFSGDQPRTAKARRDRDLIIGSLFRAVQPGIVQASAADGAWASFVRIAPEAYVGLAQYRHLEDDPDE